MKEEQKAFFIPGALRQHYGLAFQTLEETPVNYPPFTLQQLNTTLQTLKSTKASGPHKLRPELHKALKDTQTCLPPLTN